MQQNQFGFNGPPAQNSVQLSPQSLQHFSTTQQNFQSKKKMDALGLNVPKAKGYDLNACEFIPGQLTNAKKESCQLEDSEAQQEMNSKKELTNRFDTFVKERATLIAKQESDYIDIDKIKDDKKQSIEIDVDDISKKYDNPDKKI